MGGHPASQPPALPTLLLQATCPNCGTEATTYFGDILSITGNRKKNTIQCTQCKANLSFDAVRREVEVVDELVKA